ncbi:hypothetical protein GF324_13790 [bacterium]|nr:hypothetical protein [bacterium]
MKIHLAAGSDVGTVRKRNEDCYLLGEHIGRDPLQSLSIHTEEENFRRRGFLAAVADGMGGYEGGQFAAEFVLEHLRDSFYHDTRDGADLQMIARQLVDYLHAANDALVAETRRSEQLRYSGTTIVGFVMVEAGLTVFHAGDSRLVRVQDGHLISITQDHSLMASYMQKEGASVEEALRMPNARSLTNGMGPLAAFKPAIDIDHGIQKGDRVMLCSDGLYAYGGGVPDEILREALTTGENLDDLVPNLLQLARRHDGGDNATLILADLA